MEVISGLPPELAAVPAGPTRPDDPDAPAKQAAWSVWSQRVYQYRLQVLKDANAHPAIARLEWMKCKHDPAYFITVYGHLHEPRLRPRKKKGDEDDDGLDVNDPHRAWLLSVSRKGIIPWLPFERQVQMIRWWQDCMDNIEDEDADGISSKSRDVGASWIFCGLMVWGWLFEENFSALCMSRNELLVDSKSPKSLFSKMDKLLSHLPTYLMPAGFSITQHRQKLLLRHPSQNNYITGESTNSSAGVGDRVTMMFFDEAARIPDFLNIWMNAAESTDHRFACSTENMDNGPDFYNLARGIDLDYSPSQFPFEWFQHPQHDARWYQRKKRAIPDEEAFEREINRNPFMASYFVYPTAREKQNDPAIHRLPGAPLYVTIDPGFEDATAIVWLQLNHHTGQYEVIQGYTNSKLPAAFYGCILTGKVVDIHGVPVTGDWTFTDYDEEIMAWVRALDVEPRYFGDMYGESQNGATADSWYSVFRERFDVRVLADRTPTGKTPAYRMEARTHKGRREAMRWILPRLAFGDTVGCRQALYALQNNRFSQSRTGRIPERGMFRDGTTHYTSALEYWAANLKIESDLSSFYESRAERQKAEAEEYASGSRVSRLAQGARMT